MADVIVEKTDLENAADAIREKLGTQDLMTTAEMADNISSIEGGEVIMAEKVEQTIYPTGVAAQHTLSVAKSGVNVLDVGVSPWGAVRCTGKYPWELADNDGVFRSSYLFDGTTQLEWETVGCTDSATSPHSRMRGAHMLYTLQGAPFYTDWATMQFSQTSTLSVSGVSGKIYTCSTPVQFLCQDLNDNLVEVTNPGSDQVTVWHVSDGMGVGQYGGEDTGGETTKCTSANLDWSGFTLSKVYDKATDTWMTPGNKAPKMLIYTHDWSQGHIFPILSLWVANTTTLADVISELVASKTYITARGSSAQMRQVPDSIMSAWKSLPTTQGQHTISLVSGPDTQFSYTMDLGTSQPALELYPTVTNSHINNEMAMEDYDCIILSPSGTTPPSNITIW